MNILYTNYHAGPNIGGHTVYVTSLARALSGKHTITVATPKDSGLFRVASTINKVTVVAQDFPNRIFERFGQVRKFRALIKSRDIDVIHVNGSSDHRLVILATRWMGRDKPKIVFTKHNDIAVSWLGATIRVLIGTDYVIGVCDFVKKLLLDSPYAKLPIRVIPNGVDTNRFSPMPVQESLALRQQWLGDLPEDTLIFGSNAGTDGYKGWMDLVTALAGLPEEIRSRAIVVLAGPIPGDARQAAVNALNMKDRVRYVGPLEDVRPFLAPLDVGFVLSHRVETISFACREMMSMGKPVLVSSQGGLPENITQDTDGWVVPKGDVAAISAVVERIFAQRDRLPAMGVAARAKSVSEFGLEKFARETEQVYMDVLR